MPRHMGGSASLTFINHAGFRFDCGAIRLVCDPWLSGPAFNRGWLTISPTSSESFDFSSVTHIWISHQHPDHLSPRDLRNIDPTSRSRITVLYQKTPDRLVASFLRALQFKEVIEVLPHHWLRLSADVECMVTPAHDGDSWLAVRWNGKTLLNLNDCVLDHADELARIRREVGPVDVLMSQFSYANWSGNPEETEFRAKKAREKLDSFVRQVAFFEPTFVVPFASFIYFANEENFFMNDQTNRVDAVATEVMDKTRAKPIVLYPGERWDLTSEHPWQESASQYAADLQQKLALGPALRVEPTSAETLEAGLEVMYARIRRNLPSLFAWLPIATSVFVKDMQKTLKLSLKGYNIGAPCASADDIETAAENVNFCLRAPWGANALDVNGRFTTPNKTRAYRYFRFFRVVDAITRSDGRAIRLFILLASGYFRALATRRAPDPSTAP